MHRPVDLYAGLVAHPKRAPGPSKWMKLRPCRAANLPVDIQALPKALTETLTDRQSHLFGRIVPTFRLSAAACPIFSCQAVSERRR